MKRVIACALLLGACTSVMDEPTTLQAYDGPPRAEQEIAVLRIAAPAYAKTIDGRDVPWRDEKYYPGDRSLIQMLPGSHRLRCGYQRGSTKPGGMFESSKHFTNVTFDAQAGQVYRLEVWRPRDMAFGGGQIQFRVVEDMGNLATTISSEWAIRADGTVGANGARILAEWEVALAKAPRAKASMPGTLTVVVKASSGFAARDTAEALNPGYRAVTVTSKRALALYDAKGKVIFKAPKE